MVKKGMRVRHNFERQRKNMHSHSIRNPQQQPVFRSRPMDAPIWSAMLSVRIFVPRQNLENSIRPHYKGRMKSYDPKSEAWDLYHPQIGWSDPPWPNSIPQVHISGGGGTVCHEFGHVLGAPDYYHAPEKFDGVSGAPCLDWAYGPTGPGYCRYIYNAFLTVTNYPTYATNGTYTLYPRKTNPAGDKVLGCFVPSFIRTIFICLEYVKDEKAPLGNQWKQGLLIHVINVTLTCHC